MPEQVSNKAKSGGSRGTVYVESSDEEQDDDAWNSSPERSKGKAVMNHATPIAPKRADTRRTPALNPLKTSSPFTLATPQSHGKPSNTPSSSRTGVLGVPTPIKDISKTASTSASISTSIDSAFKNLTVGRRSPTKETRVREKLIVIDDSDRDEVSTDVESVPSPTRPSYSQGTSFTNSSFSSANTLISPPISATSSFTSVASSSKGSEQTTRLLSTPTRVDDVFNAPRADNVTTRRTPKSQPQVSQKPNQIMPIISDQLGTDAAVIRFAKSSFCTDLEPCIIAHCDETQRLLDNNLISWGTQYELARGVTNGTWTWANIRENILKLQGKSADSAYRVRSVMRGQENILKEAIDLSFWRELDREQDAILENQGAGLGLNPSNQNWYGGQIQQLARLIGENGHYKIVLEPMEKRRSHRFARFYGSRRILQLRIPEQTLQKESHKVVKFLTRSFVLCGRIFVPFHSKEGSLYMVETDQNYGRRPVDFFGDQYRMPFHKFINWHNPLADPKNCNQTITKYATRFAIGLSNSVPALEFQAQNIVFIDDITTEDWPEGKPNPPAEKLMTDGCGYMNHSALHAIVKHMDYDAIPAAVQGRIAGAKGLWVLHPDDTSDEPKIWIRHSQNKIKYSEYDRSHRIFDLLGPSRPSASISLSEQSIINLFNNGVPADTLLRLMEEGLEEEVAPLMDWDRPHAMVFLWDAINKSGNVSGSRTQRISVALNRALGLKGRDWGRDNDGIDAGEDGVEGADDGPTLNTGRNIYSGAPCALHEVAAELVQAGFHPAEMELLYDKIRYIVDTAMRTSIQKYRILIPESLGAYIMPDYFGLLKEDEIFYRFSKPRKDPASGMLIHTLEGPVLIGRYPIMLGSDMKKVTACYYRELEIFQDVVVLPIKGYRSLANELAGGDMDGDEVILIWAEEIVAPFKNTPLVEQPKDFMKDNFESGSTVKSVRDFCRTSYSSPRATSEAFMGHLLANLNDSQVGLYNMMHKNAAIAYGYHDSKTIRLAYIFTTLLDASKTGHRLKQGIKEKDLAKYSNSSQHMKDLMADAADRNILSLLNIAAKKKAEELFERYDRKKPQKYVNQDKDLRSPYDDMFKFALEAQQTRKFSDFLEELGIIRAHVNKAKDMWISACAKSKEKQSPVKGKAFKKAKNEDLMLECINAYAAPIEGLFLLNRDVRQIKASYAYCDSPKFAFTVAFLDLCHIKAAASPGGIAPSLRIFDDAKTISPSFLRALKAVDQDSIYS